MNRLVLIDGNAILHRAFHALPPLTAPDGSVVNAVYGFTSMLLKILHDLQPTHVAVAFDRPKPTFRKELFKGYQAKRPKMDDDLVPQIEKVHSVLRALRIAIFEMDGFEADDVIGTLAKRATASVIPGLTRDPSSSSKTGFRLGGRNDNKNGIDQVIIVTGDRDILQLVVDEKVFVYMPTKGLSEAKLYGEKEVVGRLGVAPKYVADLKALAGDNSDNYPGVAGIGPKTAVSLIMEFGAVESLYKALTKHDPRLKKVSPATIEKLESGAKDAVLFKEVASIRTDVPLEGTIDECKVTTLNSEEARQELLKLGFQSLVKRLQGDKGQETGDRKKGKVASEDSSDPKETQKSEQQELF